MIIATKKQVQKNEGGYYYTDFGSGFHYKTEYRLWISKPMVSVLETDEDGELWLPTLVKGKIGMGKSPTSLILRPGDRYIFSIEADPGYRGTAEIEILSKIVCALKYPIYHSPRGNLGIGEGAIIETINFPVRLKVTRTGRLYGDSPEKWWVIDFKDGGLIETEYEPALEEDLEEG